MAIKIYTGKIRFMAIKIYTEKIYTEKIYAEKIYAGANIYKEKIF